MIAKAKSVAVSSTRLAYTNGESPNKKHPEKIFFIKHNLMPDYYDAQSIGESMDLSRLRAKTTRPMKKNVIRFEISPEKRYTDRFTDQDWLSFTEKFIEIFDSLEFKDKDGKIYSPKTNIAGSKYMAYLHRDADSGIPHVHLIANRFDEDGNINNDHNLMIRAHQAAERIDRLYGWDTAMEVSERNYARVSADCLKVLKAMPRWNMDDYRQRLLDMGYDEVNVRYDNGGKLVGYSIKKGNTYYKASKLGKNRNLSTKKIADTWTKLHAPAQRKAENPRPHVPSQNPKATPKPQNRANQSRSEWDIAQEHLSKIEDTKRPFYNPRYLSYSDGMVPRWLNIDGENLRFFIPKFIDDEIDDTFSWREYENSDELKNMTLSLFVAYVDGATTVAPGSAGGTSSDLAWGKDPREEELERLRNCALKARKHIAPIPKKAGGPKR